MKALIGFVGGLAVVLMAASYGPGIHQEFWTFVGHGCSTIAEPTIVSTAGVTVATISNASIPDGSSCTVLPPAGVPASVALHCVATPGAAAIIASTGLLLGTTAPAGEWCVEVRTVAPAFRH